MLDEVGGEDVDVVLGGLDVRILPAIAAKRSSQNGMLWMMPFDLVADVTCRLGRLRASSNA